MARLFCSLWLLAAGTLLRAADSSVALPDLAASGRLEELRWPDFAEYRDQVVAFYARRDYTPAWTHQGSPTRQAESVIGVLKTADAKGLDPEDYDASRWDKRSETHGFDPVRFDLALTVSLMRYISDLHFGRANPGLFHGGFDIGDASSVADFISRDLVNSSNVKDVLASIEPPFEGYRRTQAALETYLTASREAPIQALPAVKKPIEPGSAYPAAVQLTAVLRKLGDLPADAVAPADSYSGPLVDAVKRFQRRHGLEQDGRIGTATLAELNTPLDRRVRQLQLSLERWRWVPHSFPRPPVVVNIPEFELRAFGGDGHPELEMKVVVGKAFHHQTPVFSGEMKQVIFRPYWDVPFSIQKAELVPKIEEDHSYLSKNHYEVVTMRNEVVSTGAVDDALLARLRSGELRIRQAPGPENSLGLVKFLLPNAYDVYLHATPATALFSRARRDFSHGCIRVEKPVDLAAWVLRDKPEWTRERILEAMNGDRTIAVTLDRPIPVLIVYATAVVLSNGEVRFFDDIYGLDAQLEQALAKRYRAAAITSAAPGRGPRE